MTDLTATTVESHVTGAFRRGRAMRTDDGSANGQEGAIVAPSVPPPPFTGMELADAVEAVRSGLMAGAAAGADAGLRFEVGEIHMEFTVQLERVRTGRGGVKAWVVEAGGEASRSLARTHTVSFTLRPLDATTGRPPHITAPDEPA
jgi:hypothetical protein